MTSHAHLWLIDTSIVHPTPYLYLKLAQVNQTWYEFWTSDLVWEKFNVHRVTNICQHYLSLKSTMTKFEWTHIKNFDVELDTFPSQQELDSFNLYSQLNIYNALSPKNGSGKINITDKTMAERVVHLDAKKCRFTKLDLDTASRSVGPWPPHELKVLDFDWNWETDVPDPNTTEEAQLAELAKTKPWILGKLDLDRRTSSLMTSAAVANWRCLEYLPARIDLSMDTYLVCVKSSWRSVKFAPLWMRRDKKFMIACLEMDKRVGKYAAKKLKLDRDIYTGRLLGPLTDQS